MPRRGQHAAVARYAAPAVFLLAVTIAIVLVRAGLDNGNAGSPAVVVSTAPPTTNAGTTGAARKTKRPKKRFYVIQSGDTFGTVAAKFGTTVEALQALNPSASSNALTVGQRIRIK